MKRQRAFTLVELLVYCSLLGMMLLAIYSVFIASMRYFRVAQAATELQSAAQMTVLNMVADLGDSRASTVVVSTSPAGLVFLSPRNNVGNFTFDSTGNLQWHKWVCYYRETTTNRILRKTLSITPTITPPANTYTTASFLATAGQTVAENVTELTVTSASTVTISATFEKTVFSSSSGATDNRVQITDRVLLRN